MKKILEKELRYKNFNISVKYKKIRYLRLKIDENLCVKLSLPLYCDKKTLELFLEKNYAWLEQRYELLSKAKKDEKIYFLGKAYELIFDEKLDKTYIKKGLILSKNKASYEKFLRKNALKIFSFYIKKWQKHFDKKVNKLSVKYMKTRWGSCNSQKAYINLNLALMQKSLKAIEYVVLHELTHLKFADHSKNFYKELEGLMPDFRQRELEFKKY